MPDCVDDPKHAIRRLCITELSKWATGVRRTRDAVGVKHRLWRDVEAAKLGKTKRERVKRREERESERERERKVSERQREKTEGDRVGGQRKTREDKRTRRTDKDRRSIREHNLFRPMKLQCEICSTFRSLCAAFISLCTSL